MSENPWILINRGTQAKGWRGSGKWNQEEDTISHFCGPLSYFRICCNESLRHSTDTFKWWRKFIVQWRAPDKIALPPLFVRSLWSEKESQTAQQVCSCKPAEICKWAKEGRVFLYYYFSSQNVYGEGVGWGIRAREVLSTKGIAGWGGKRDLKRRMSPFYGCAIHVPIKPRWGHKGQLLDTQG